MVADPKMQKLLEMRRKTIHDAEEFVVRHIRTDEFEAKEADVEVFGRLAHRRFSRPPGLDK